MDDECKYLVCHRLNGYWQCECTNPKCDCYTEDCIEKDVFDPVECEYREVQNG